MYEIHACTVTPPIRPLCMMSSQDERPENSAFIRGLIRERNFQNKVCIYLWVVGEGQYYRIKIWKHKNLNVGASEG